MREENEQDDLKSVIRSAMEGIERALNVRRSRLEQVEKQLKELRERAGIDDDHQWSFDPGRRYRETSMIEEFAARHLHHEYRIGSRSETSGGDFPSELMREINRYGTRAIDSAVREIIRAWIVDHVDEVGGGE